MDAAGTASPDLLGEELRENMEDKQLKDIQKVRTGKRKYKGFLHVKCPYCGRIRSFYKRVPGSCIHCKCGRNYDLKHMVPVWVNCECGHRPLRYLTNRDERIFDIECLHCGMPVCVEWKPKKHCYTKVQD